MTIWKEKNE